MGEAGALALYEDELDMVAVRALLAAGPNHLGGAQPLPVAASDTLPPLLHTQVYKGVSSYFFSCRVVFFFFLVCCLRRFFVSLVVRGECVCVCFCRSQPKLKNHSLIM